jgi:hypothetical protein
MIRHPKGRLDWVPLLGGDSIFAPPLLRGDKCRKPSFMRTLEALLVPHPA